jgi:hypothetical protein
MEDKYIPQRGVRCLMIKALQFKVTFHGSGIVFQRALNVMVSLLVTSR